MEFVHTRVVLPVACTKERYESRRRGIRTAGTIVSSRSIALCNSLKFQSSLVVGIVLQVVQHEFCKVPPKCRLSDQIQQLSASRLYLHRWQCQKLHCMKHLVVILTCRCLDSENRPTFLRNSTSERTMQLLGIQLTVQEVRRFALQPQPVQHCLGLPGARGIQVTLGSAELQLAC